MLTRNKNVDLYKILMDLDDESLLKFCKSAVKQEYEKSLCADETFWRLRTEKYYPLNDNQISEIPKEIVQLQNLQRLHLSSNQISEIPQEIGQLQNLRELYLHYNQIKEIPKEIGQLQNLQKLYLYNNKIKEIPKFINSNTKVYI